MPVRYHGASGSAATAAGCGSIVAEADVSGILALLLWLFGGAVVPFSHLISHERSVNHSQKTLLEYKTWKKHINEHHFHAGCA